MDLFDMVPWAGPSTSIAPCYPSPTQFWVSCWAVTTGRRALTRRQRRVPKLFPLAPSMFSWLRRAQSGSLHRITQ